MNLYVQFPEEPLEVAIAAHDGEPFNSIEECKDFVAESEDVGRTFNVVDDSGRVHFMGLLTYEGVEEVTPDDLDSGG